MLCFSGGGSHSVNDKAVGVIAMDFAANYFYVLLLRSFSDCESNNPGYDQKFGFSVMIFKEILLPLKIVTFLILDCSR